MDQILKYKQNKKKILLRNHARNFLNSDANPDTLDTLSRERASLEHGRRGLYSAISTMVITTVAIQALLNADICTNKLAFAF